MSLSLGTRLGPYEIAAQIGVGGMGEVYRAIDTNLKRPTAIKVLPASMASDTERVARFQREAEVLAALNHPNIAAVYGLERSGASLALVMELVEGPTLADRVAEGPLPVDEALVVARQVADGLEAAHEQGIVHRDLKPANIKLRPDGTVKILDFGLAKAVDTVGASAGASFSPTITSPAMTRLGMILGTAAYMSPEQARGKPVDKRADIFAFGCVLFELLTGTRTFGGDDISLTLAEVIKSEPDWAALPPLPPTVLMYLRRCLIKDPRLRLRDIGEMHLALSEAFDIRTFVGTPTAPSTSGRAWRWVLPCAVLSAIAGAALALVFHRPPQPPPPPLPDVIRFDIHAPAGSKIPPGVPAVSPDGRSLVYSMVGPDRIPHLYLHDLATGQARLLPGTENGVHPFWSPDGRSLAFASERTLKRLDIAGGPVRDLAEVTGPWHGTWGKAGDVLFNASGVKRISAEGGQSSPAVNLDDKQGETGSAFPAFLPDGKRYLVRIDRDGKSTLHLASLDSTQRTPILDGILSAPLIATTPRGDAFILYLRDDALVAQQFDERAGKPLGTQRVLVEGIGRVANPPNMPTAGVSPTGTLAYQTGGNFTAMVLTWVTRGGAAGGQVPLEVTGQNPTLSRDGRLLAIDVTSAGNRDVWVADVGRGVTTRITYGGGVDRSPTWSPDSRRIAFWRGKKIYVTNADGSGDATVLADVDGVPQSWSADGRYLLYRKEQSLFLWPFAGGASIPVGSRAGSAEFGQFSPDSRAIAFTSNESGHDEVYVQLIPPVAGPVRVSTSGGKQSRWGRTSSELFYLSADRMMTSVTLRVGTTVSVDVPKKLFPVELGTVFSNMRFDLDVPRQRFLVPRIAGESIPDVPITVVLNWWTEFVKKPN